MERERERSKQMDLETEEQLKLTGLEMASGACE